MNGSPLRVQAGKGRDRDWVRSLRGDSVFPPRRRTGAEFARFASPILFHARNWAGFLALTEWLLNAIGSNGKTLAKSL